MDNVRGFTQSGTLLWIIFISTVRQAQSDGASAIFDPGQTFLWASQSTSGDVLQMASSSPTTLYGLYAGQGILNPLGPSLLAEGRTFTLNGKPIQLFSGAMHYFRVVPGLWRDRLKKMRACGLNTVETYVPWNAHEEKQNQYDFSGILDLRRFLQIAQEEDLFVILRPGPYICSEWEYGGLPSWLLRDPEMKVRTSDPTFMNFVERYFKNLFPQVVGMQFSKGGPIIAVQVENEYGSFGGRGVPKDKEYLRQIKAMMEDGGIRELLFTSDGVTLSGDSGALDGVLMTANFQSYPKPELDKLLELQPNRPLMVMEFWAGWFDHWGEHHHLYSIEHMKESLAQILEYNASVNFYMFHGGTNFGFWNGANVAATPNHTLKYQPTITSYDYDAPLTEAGHYTEKYSMIQDFIAKATQGKPWNVPVPPTPLITAPKPLEHIQISVFLPLKEMMEAQEIFLVSKHLVPMEFLDIGDSGQGYGFTIYRTRIPLKLEEIRLEITGVVRDRCQVLINGKEVATFFVNEDIPTLHITAGKAEEAVLDLVVENMGRVNFGNPTDFLFSQTSKGINGEVFLDKKPIQEWEIYPLDFKPNYFSRLSRARWRKYIPGQTSTNPGLYKATFNIPYPPRDTFINMRDWTKGVVFVNGFNLGRYWSIGPQETLYVPAPLLRQGENEIMVFELHQESPYILTQANPALSKSNRVKRLTIENTTEEIRKHIEKTQDDPTAPHTAPIINVKV